MQPSLREDYLEAIQLFSEKNEKPPRYEELATALGKPESQVRTDMEDLVASGDVFLVPWGNDIPDRTGTADRYQCHEKT